MYQYVHNNPHRYHDPDGQTGFEIAITLIKFTFGASLGPIILPTMAVVAGATLAYGVYHGLGKLDVYMNQVDAQDVNDVKKDQDQEDKNKAFEKPDSINGKKTPPRTKPKNLNEQLTLDEAKANNDGKYMVHPVL